ncbi:hypothetical protein BOX15_Mlig021362g3 [Macrostomum lignano]|nr:hypothetical protein BOX15_Mlig021362g3 [Macrostomum lignano]
MFSWPLVAQLLMLLLLSSGPVGGAADGDASNRLGPPTHSEVADAIAELRDQRTAGPAATAAAAALSRAMLLLKRMELHGGWDGELAKLTFDWATASRTLSTVDTIGLPGESVEFQLKDQPEGTVYVCLNASRDAGAAMSEVRPLRSGGRVQVRLVPYKSPLTGKPWQQLELTVQQLTCWDTGRRYTCCALQPPTAAGDVIQCRVFGVQSPLCPLH